MCFSFQHVLEETPHQKFNFLKIQRLLYTRKYLVSERVSELWMKVLRRYPYDLYQREAPAKTGEYVCRIGEIVKVHKDETGLLPRAAPAKRTQVLHTLARITDSSEFAPQRRISFAIPIKHD
jgi:hypothetical protein